MEEWRECLERENNFMEHDIGKKKNYMDYDGVPDCLDSDNDNDGIDDDEDVDDDDNDGIPDDP